MKDTKYPNCMKCKWVNIYAIGVLDGSHICGAQGYKYCGIVYDNNKCRELYEEKEEE